MDGSGTQDNPYIITTFYEMIQELYNGSDYVKYYKLGNDINILEEYPNGMPSSIALRNVDLDGNNKTISNWDKSSGYMITFASDGTYSKVHNLNFNNINLPSTATAFMCGNDQQGFENCTFRGQINKHFLSAADQHSDGPVKFKSCSFKIKDLRTGDNQFNTSGKCPYFDSCYFEYEGGIASAPFMDYQPIDGIFAVNSYFDMKLPNSTAIMFSSYMNKIKNCALDIETNAAMQLVGDSSSISIYNSTKAPNISQSSTYVAGITTANWLNIQALEQAGFNVVPSE